MQYLLAVFIPERNVIESYALPDLRNDDAPACGGVFFKGAGELFDKSQCRAQPRKQCQKLGYGSYHKIHEIDKHYYCACRKSPSAERDICACKKNAELRRNLRYRACHSHKHRYTPLTEFFLFKSAVALGKQPEYLFFRAEVFTTSNPERQSLSAAVKSRLRSDPRCSAACIRKPGSSVTATATTVMSGE